MAISRKQALKKLEGLRPQVEQHLGKMEAEPDSPSVDHWREEVRTWLRDMERALPHVGQKTAEEWARQIDALRQRLGG
jgi:hypothetical protein